MGDVGTLFMEGRSHRLEFLELQPPMLGTPGAEVVAEATPPRRSLPPPRPLKSIHLHEKHVRFNPRPISIFN